MDLKKLANRFPGTAFAMAIVIVILAAGCDEDELPTAPVDDTPPAPTITETFSGSFGQNGTSQHVFTVVARGDITLEITSLEPVATLTVGMSLGRFDAAAEQPCSVFASDNRVVVGSVLLSSNREPGEYCVNIGDVGNVFPDATVTYTVDVTHP